jgi:hypothetical protein
MSRLIGASIPTRQTLVAAPSLIAALLVTELFFKFGSFTLEFLGCCAVWGALYGAQSAVTGMFKKPQQ